MTKTNLEVSNDLMGLARILLAHEDSPLDMFKGVVFRNNNMAIAPSPANKVINISYDRKDEDVYFFSDFISHQPYAPKGGLIDSVFPAKLEPGILDDVFRVFIGPVCDNQRNLFFEKVIPSWIAQNTGFYLEDLMLKSSWKVKYPQAVSGVLNNFKVSAFDCSLGNIGGRGVFVWNHHPKSVVLANQAEINDYCSKHDIKTIVG